MNNHFKKTNLAILVTVALFSLSSQSMGRNLGAGAFNPRESDGNGNGLGGKGHFTVSGGTETLTSAQLSGAGGSFEKGDSGGESRPISDIKAEGGFDDPKGYLDKDRLGIGPLNNGISVPDPITGGSITVQTHDTTLIKDIGSAASLDEKVWDVHNVGDNQYIDLRIADVKSGGKLTVDLGDGGGHTTQNNHLDLAAKQTTLFEIKDTGGEINWDSKNRVTFSAASADINNTKVPFNINNIPVYKGLFFVKTLDGKTKIFNVKDSTSLKNYNEWLITELQRGNLDPTKYAELFDKAVKLTTQQVHYDYKADTSKTNDDIFKATGNNSVIHASGSDAKVTINGTLETNYTYGYGNSKTDESKVAIKIDGGGQLNIETGAIVGVYNGTAITLKDNSKAENKGTINGNFLLKDDGTVATQTNDRGVTVIRVEGKSSLDNQGTINISTAGKYTNEIIGLYINSELGAAATTNSGTINLGIQNSVSDNRSAAVDVATGYSKFINTGDINIGAGYNGVGDVAINQKSVTSGIRVASRGSAINDGTITIGEKVQNAAAMYAQGGDATELMNNGTIDIKGAASAVPNVNYGMLVTNSGADGKIANTGTINLSGVNAIGIKVLSTESGKANALNTGNIIIEGGADPASGTRNYGVWVEGQGSETALATVKGNIELKGDGAIGVHARGNAEVTVDAASEPKFISGRKQIGYFAYGDLAQINIVDGSGSAVKQFEVGTEGSTMFRLENGADLGEDGLDMTTSGDGSYGIMGTGKGTEIKLTQANIHLTGENSTGAVIEGGAVGHFDAGTKFDFAKDGTVGVEVDGNKHNLAGTTTDYGVTSTIVESGAKLTNSNAVSSDVTGYIIRNSGTLNLTSDSKIDFTQGTDNTGVLIFKNGNLNNDGTIHVANGTGVHATGAGSQVTKIGKVTVDDGRAGVFIDDGAQLKLQGGDSQIVTDGTAHGILLGNNAAALSAQNTKIDILGTGNGIENEAEINNITLANATINVKNGSGIRTGVTINPASTAVINVSGSGTGFDFSKADGSQTTGDLMLGNGYKINASGAGATGINALTDGVVHTLANVNVSHANGGSALVAGTASHTINRGSLTSSSTSAPVVDLSNSTAGTTFDNLLGIISASSATAVAVQGSGQNDVLNFVNGVVRGEIDSGAGTDDELTMQNTRFEGGIKMGATNSKATITRVNLGNTSHITSVAGGENTLTFNTITAKGGSFAADDLGKGTNLGDGWKTINFSGGTKWTLTDNLKLSGSEVNINSGSVLYAGNSVNAVISGGTPTSLSVNNLGSIDLTNGGDLVNDVLTIQGNYLAMTRANHSSGTSRLYLNTAFNQGGALADQKTDRLLIDGNVKGRTLVSVIPQNINGMATDLNGDHKVSSNEGISIVQVSGSSTEDAFRLSIGYVAAGAYAYGLYAFAPGESDAGQRVVAGTGSQFWDYRLANLIACADDSSCARLEVVPQVPSYISVLTGLTHYNAQNTDDLHKRLGELRGKEFDADGDVFARYIRSDYTYHTDIAAKRYGYNFDIDANTLQIGGNLFRVRKEDNLFRGGLAWSHGNTTIKPDAIDGYSKAKTKSDAIALYLTWNDRNNFYVDGMLSYDWHRTDVDTKAYSKISKLKADGWSASIETGYPFEFDNGVVLEPQLQLSYHELKMKDMVDKDNVKVHFNKYDQFIGRIGVRANKTWLTEDGKLYTPYVRLNYYQGWGGNSVASITDAQHVAPVARFTGGDFGQALQAGFGLTATFKNNFSIYGEADYQKEIGHGARGYRFNIGGRWLF